MNATEFFEGTIKALEKKERLAAESYIEALKGQAAVLEEKSDLLVNLLKEVAPELDLGDVK